jgi:hypothetical protein
MIMDTEGAGVQFHPGVAMGSPHPVGSSRASRSMDELTQARLLAEYPANVDLWLALALLFSTLRGDSG